ncbi:putative endonuclease [Treponema bryantii]|uniref:Putative endonuclease n=1 Tax=Treponema bryantii TaxID=163 RepID=A0A1I3N4Y3_9SPIR|nr:putative endonuclease [Treponema bryantii]
MSEYTKHCLPVKHVYFEECLNIEDAFLREKQIQGWSRKKRESLISGDYMQLKQLSRKKFWIKIIMVSICPTGYSTTVKHSMMT